MLDKNLQDINISDLQNLVDNKVMESSNLEYKKVIQLVQPSEKKEFLADISSFANANGGDLIVGVKDDPKTREPIAVEGVEFANVDSEILKMENLIRDGIKPRVWGIHIHHVAISERKVVLIFRIPNSWSAPHRVDFDGHNKFYTRGSNGKYQMDVGDLRTAFNLSQTISDRIRSFRNDRINNITSNQSYLPLPNGAKVIMHLIPFSAFGNNNAFQFRTIQNYTAEMRPMGGGGWDFQYNLDGFMCFNNERSYTQVFKNGIIEAVNGTLLGEHAGRKIIPSQLLERTILQAFTSYENIYARLNTPLPIVVSISLTGIVDYEFAAERYRPFYGNRFPHRMEILNLPENIIQKKPINIHEVFQPIFDSLWNSYGYEKSQNFNENGVWNPNNT